MPPTSLKVPLAYDEVLNFVRIEDAEQGKRYFCPACGTPLIFRHGTVKVPHFAHKASETCSQETIIHKTAKLLVQQAVTDWKAGKTQPPIVQRMCAICQSLVDQPLPDKVEAAVLERPLADGFIADVALLVGDKVEAAVEIKVTHAVGEVKSTSLSIPFIEVDGYAVLDNPTRWIPITDRFKPLTCRKCTHNFQRFQKKTAQIAQRTGIELPTEYYRYALCSCWRCKKDILVFTWPGRDLFETSQPSKQPMPKTVRYEYSKTTNSKYWANACPYCHVIQGDWFLYMEPDEPFFAFNCGDDTPEAFHQDLMVLAHLADYRGYL